jgi:LysR family transcriptional regulator for metE and metH
MLFRITEQGDMAVRSVTLKQLRVLAAVVRAGSVTGGARLLNVSASAVTLQMQLLADCAGLALAERVGTATQPTEAGRMVLAAGERIEAALAECSAGLASLAGADSGMVRVGIVSSAKYFAPRALGAFARSRRGIALQLDVGNRADIVKRLESGDIDVAIIGRTPESLQVVAGSIGFHPHVVVAPPRHRLAGRRHLSASVLDDEMFLPREPGSGTRSLMESYFAAAGVSPVMGMQISSNETIKQAVIAGLGIAFISAHAVEFEVATARLAILDIEGLPILREWRVVRVADRTPTPAAAALTAFLLAEGQHFLPKIAAESL